MAIQSTQFFETVVIQYDDAVYKELSTLQLDGKIATIKIVKITDVTNYIIIDKQNGLIRWGTRYPIASAITQTKGLTVMLLS